MRRCFLKVNTIISHLNKITGITRNNNNFNIKQKSNPIITDSKDGFFRQKITPRDIISQDELLMLKNLFPSENNIKAETNGHSINRNKLEQNNLDYSVSLSYQLNKTYNINTNIGFTKNTNWSNTNLLNYNSTKYFMNFSLYY